MPMGKGFFKPFDRLKAIFQCDGYCRLALFQLRNVQGKSSFELLPTPATSTHHKLGQPNRIVAFRQLLFNILELRTECPERRLAAARTPRVCRLARDEYTLRSRRLARPWSVTGVHQTGRLLFFLDFVMQSPTVPWCSPAASTSPAGAIGREIVAAVAQLAFRFNCFPQFSPLRTLLLAEDSVSCDVSHFNRAKKPQVKLRGIAC